MAPSMIPRVQQAGAAHLLTVALFLAMITIYPTRSSGFVISPARSPLRPAQVCSTTTPTTMMAAGRGGAEQYDWVDVIAIKDAPAPGTATSVFAANLDLCVAADDSGLLYVIGNKCPPANQPLSFSKVVNKTIKDPVLGTVIDLETGDVLDWCPSLLGKLLRPILGSAPQDAGVVPFKVRSTKGVLQAYVQVNALAQYEQTYWKGILDAQGKADGGYY